MISTKPNLQIRTPTRFTASSIIMSSLYGVILVVPVLGAMLAVTMFRLGVLTFVIPVAAIGLATFFLPLGFGNPYIARVVRSLRPVGDVPPECWIVQLTREPRLRTGLMATLEDADDVGFLSYTDSSLEFRGDSIVLSTPYSCIRGLKQQNAGPRALFAYGSRTVFAVAGLSEIRAFHFAERGSCLISSSRRKANEMYQALKRRVDAADGLVSADKS